MMQYLKSRQYYTDLYDRMTVEDCRWRENFHKNAKPSEELAKKVNEKFYRGVSDIALHYDLLYATIRWHENKEKTISEWIERDTHKDELYENAEAPEKILCLKCQSLTTPGSKILYDSHDDKGDRVLFMYDCPNGCLPHRAFFHDGEEYKTKPHLCPKCEGILERNSERVEDKKVVTTERCPNCGHVETDEFDLREDKETKSDPDFEKDRERFCLSGEQLEKNLKEKSQLEGIARLVDKWKERDQNKEVYDKVAKLKKLKVIDLEKLLAPELEKAGYIKFKLGEPEIERNVIVPFSVHDSKDDRNDRVSTHDLQKLIKKMLQDTNWRLMGDGTSYRLGMLSGRLKAYESEEDLVKLIK